MNGTINVVDKSENPNITTGNSTVQPSANIDTIGTLMVLTGDLPKYTSDLENGGFSILSTYNFNDIQGGGSTDTHNMGNIFLWHKLLRILFPN